MGWEDTTHITQLLRHNSCVRTCVYRMMYVMYVMYVCGVDVVVEDVGKVDEDKVDDV